MQVTIDPPFVLDVVAFLLMSFVGIAGLVKALSTDNAPGIVFSVIFTTIVLTAICSCGGAQPKPVIDDGSPDRCAGLIALACAHDSRCGGPPLMDCIDAQVAPCAAATGLTQEETQACAKGIVESDCAVSEFPEACYGIFGEDPVVESPQPKTLAL